MSKKCCLMKLFNSIRACAVLLVAIPYQGDSQDLTPEVFTSLIKFRGDQIENYLTMHAWKFYKSVDGDSTVFGKTIFKFSDTIRDTTKPAVLATFNIEYNQFSNYPESVAAIQYRGMDANFYRQMVDYTTNSDCSIMLNRKGDDYTDK